MARPSKPVETIEGHRTKAEMNLRREAEEAMLTGTPMRMSAVVKNDKVAKKEFQRIKKLFKSIKKDDDIYSLIINTYCLLVSECEQIKDVREQFIASKQELQTDYLNRKTGDPEGDGVRTAEYYRMLAKFSDNIINCDRELMAKRKMILDISKENVMTVQSALRSIPKKPEKKTAHTGMAAFMQKRAEGNG